MSIPKKVEERMRAAIKTMQPVLTAQRDRDVSEADTVTLVKDLLSDCFGHDKYADVTSEVAIRGTYCDLAVKSDGTLRFLVEVKSIGTELGERHIRQAVDYAVKEGVEWVVLTNAIVWIVFRVAFKKPVEHRELARFDLLNVSPRDDAEIEKAFLLTREGLSKSALREFSERKEATSRYLVAAAILSEPVIACLRREMRRVTEVLVDAEALERVLRDEVIKREALEGNDATTAARRVTSSGKKAEPKSEVAPSTSESVAPQD